MARTKFTITLPCRCCQHWYDSKNRVSLGTKPQERPCPSRKFTTGNGTACERFVLAKQVWCNPSDNWMAPEMCVARSLTSKYAQDCYRCPIREDLPTALRARTMLQQKEANNNNGKPQTSRRTRHSA